MGSDDDQAQGTERISLVNVASLGELPGEVERHLSRLRTYLDSSPVGKLIVGPSGRLKYANASLSEIFGYTVEELVGMPVEQLIPPHLRGGHLHLRAAAIRGDLPLRRKMAGRDVRGLHKDGRRIWVSVGLVRLASPNADEVLATVIDTTEQRRAEEALRASAAMLARRNEELDHFTRAAAHDLQTPLRGIRNLVTWATEAMDHGDVDGARQQIDLLDTQVQRMQRLIDGLLEYSQAGSRPSDTRRVSLQELVLDSWALLEAPPGFELRMEGSYPTVDVAVTPLAQCLRNLLDNAIKHHDREQGVVVVRSQIEEGSLRIEVEDDGPGIPEAYRQQVFDFLRRLQTKERHPGPGLGLTMVQRLIEGAGGEVGVGSGALRGARFWLRWPLAAPTEGEGQAP